ncbi:hypothetical protein L6452_20146 [Arctium lappa]|uniref:Uncharacterized protein n=1 Tax=Arctium lappa TaxID=4217 RepID=A0ACB9BBU9_ARCLA|nr:hypothetical protein L6452_20146 [Arctium lappa]
MCNLEECVLLQVAMISWILSIRHRKAPQDQKQRHRLITMRSNGINHIISRCYPYIKQTRRNGMSKLIILTKKLKELEAFV